MTRDGAASIVLLSGNSLCHNPRVLKAASALARAGHDVEVIGAWLEPELKARDQRLLETARFGFTPVLDCTLPGSPRAAAANFVQRARRKAANALHGLTGWESPNQLGLTIEPMMARAEGLPADLFIAHSEPALHVAWKLMRRGRRVGVDMEDWFSEDLLPAARKLRPLRLLRFLERSLLARGVYASCPSRAMSEALSARYGCPPPVVVYNAFPWSERQTIDGQTKDRRDKSNVSICWYSQTLGPGRGLEDLIDTLPLIEGDAELHVRGRDAAGMREWIKSRVPDGWQPRVFFHPIVANDELLSRVCEHDIGFAGEIPYCRNRETTVTNKVLHYLLGGLAVVASDTAGQREISADAPGAIELYRSGDRRSLAEALNALVGRPDRLRRAKAAAVNAAERTFCWERQEGALLEAVAAAVSQQSRVSCAGA